MAFINHYDSNHSIIITTQNGCTALYVAAQSGYTKTVNELISKGAHLDIPTRVSSVGINNITKLIIMFVSPLVIRH